MTNSPNPGNGPDQSSSTRSNPTRRLWILLLRRSGFVLGVGLIVGLAGGAWWAWVFIHESLAPLIEKNLSQTLQRPVELGEVEGVSFSGLQFGPSSVPPTATDSDTVSVEGVDVAFNLLEVLLTRKLRLNITLNQGDGYAEQDAEGQWIATEIASQESRGPIKTEIDSIQLQDTDLVLVPYPPEGEPRVPIALTQVDGKVIFRDDNQRLIFEVVGRSLQGGELSLKGESVQQEPGDRQTNLALQGENLLASEIDRLLKLPIDFQAGRLGGNITVLTRPDEPASVNGVATVRGATVQVDALPEKFTEATGGLRFRGQLIGLENVTTRYGQVPGRVNGTIHTSDGYNLAAQVRSVTVDNLLDTLGVTELPFEAEGTVQANLQLTGPLDQPRITGDVRSLRTSRIDRVDFRNISTRFAFADSVVSFDQIRATPVVGGEITGAGQIKLGDDGGLVLDFQGRNLPGDAIARNYGNLPDAITLGRVGVNAQIFGPTGNLQTVVRWQAPQATYPGRGEVVVAGGTTTFRDTLLQVAGGTVSARGAIADGRWQAFLSGSQVQLRRFSPELRGLFSGDLRLAGTLDSFSPSAIRAEGQVRFSEGIAIVDQPLTASVQWDGEKIRVLQATATGFSANGLVFARLEGENAPEITNLDLNVQASNYNLATLPFAIPDQVDLRGRANFVGRLTGTPAATNLAGALQLNNLVVNNIAFEPVLQGDIQYGAARGLNLDVAGAQDRVALVFDRANRPVSFLVQQDQAIATGRRVGDNLLVDAQNVPLQAFNLTPGAAVGLGPVGGVLSGNFNVDLAQNYAVVGEFAIAQPSIGYINAEQFVGRVRYANGVATLSGGELRWGESQYLIAANFAQGADPQFSAQIQASQGRVQDILAALQWFDLEDIGRGLQPPTYDSATAVTVFPIETANLPLLTQLRRFSEIEALLARRLEEENANERLPDLQDLTGTFGGEVNIAGSPQAGIALDFDLQGEDWQWGDYQADQVIANGSFEDGVLTLLPLRFQSDETLLTFSGQIGGEQQSGQLRAENLPVEAIRDLARSPVDVRGRLNATATLAGSVENPDVRGELTLVDGSLNRTPIEAARGTFSYADARLNFVSTVVVEEPEPINIVASVPYSFPFMTTTPDSDQIRVDVDVRDEGLALLNLLNRQVAWLDGDGSLQLQVRGTLAQPLATGIAQFNGATFKAQALPEPITGVTGTVRFDRDRIIVDGVQGQFSEGQVAAQGVIPIFAALRPQDPDRANPLIADLDRIDLNLKGLYQGGVEGEVVVLGTALAPEIGGDIRLANGRISLPDGSGEETTTTPATPVTDGQTTGALDGATTDTPLEFNDLMITLGDRVQITRDPILNFIATGDLTLNGAINDIRPEGTIRLRRGQVNLFTTQFVLARGYESTATFTPNQGLDPELDVRLISSVTEVTRTPIQTTSSFATTSEVADVPATNLGALQTVRIQASVEGPASELFDNLELTSSPRRSQTEIIALIGGGFAETLGRGDSTLALANLAGSALLGNLQNFIGTATGLSEFRLFPTNTISDDERTTTLGLGAELGIDITDDISFSVLRVLTSNQPTQFGLRYRLDEEFLLRGSTDLSGDSRAVLEYQTRF